MTVRSGESITLICPDADNRLPDGGELAPGQRHAPAVPPAIEGNPLAGPIAIEGAQVGDSLAVTIDGITLANIEGRTLLQRDHGAIPARMLETDGEPAIPRHLYRWRIDPRSGTATLVNALGEHPVVVALAPFIGCIGVCPRDGKSIHAV